MGLLQRLNLRPPPSVTNPAKPGAIRIAKLAARVRKGDRREILNAAIDMAELSGSKSKQVLNAYVVDPKNPAAPVSTMAPRKAYDNLKQGTGENKHLAGRLEQETTAEAFNLVDTSTNKVIGTDFDVRTKVVKRGLVPTRLGHGEPIYKKDERGGLREPDGFKSPEALVMAHEHLHLVIAAQIAARMEEFADTAFAVSKLSPDAAGRLQGLLADLATEAGDKVDDWLDRVAVPEHRDEIDDAQALTKRLLKDGTLECLVRTALLKVLRKNARKLAEFR